MDVCRGLWLQLNVERGLLQQPELIAGLFEQLWHGVLSKWRWGRRKVVDRVLWEASTLGLSLSSISNRCAGIEEGNSSMSRRQMYTVTSTLNKLTVSNLI